MMDSGHEILVNKNRLIIKEKASLWGLLFLTFIVAILFYNHFLSVYFSLVLVTIIWCRLLFVNMFILDVEQKNIKKIFLLSRLVLKEVILVTFLDKIYVSVREKNMPGGETAPQVVSYVISAQKTNPSESIIEIVEFNDISSVKKLEGAMKYFPAIIFKNNSQL